MHVQYYSLYDTVRGAVQSYYYSSLYDGLDHGVRLACVQWSSMHPACQHLPKEHDAKYHGSAPDGTIVESIQENRWTRQMGGMPPLNLELILMNWSRVYGDKLLGIS